MELEGIFIGSKNPGFNKDITFLENLVGEEKPIVIVCVLYGDKNDMGILAALKNKLIYARKSLFSNESFEVPYSKISTANIKTGILSSNISITGSGFDYEFKQVSSDAAKIFVGKINNLINENNSPKQSVPKEDVFEKLKKLSELKNLGIISDEEYETQRKKFLAEM
jgi:hypothetical protein